MKLSNKVNQLVLINGKPMSMEVKHCFMRDGEMYGTVNYAAIKRTMKCNSGIWEQTSRSSIPKAKRLA
jgi:hypothetical protein